MVHLNAQQKARNAAVQTFLELPATIAIFEDPELANPSTDIHKRFMSDIREHNSAIQLMDRVMLLKIYIT
ncbi:hypothetical protein FRC03_000573 [Tulasnella sp. 419]|nr:hypothetical protein FRC03_000573 [Tulasnella sp. 419]